MPPELTDRLSRLPATPRLFFTPAVKARAAELAKTDADYAALCRFLVASADVMLPEPVVKHELEGRRLLGPARHAVRRVTTLCAAYTLTGDRKYFDRCRAELLALSAFPDFNPSHYLDAGEATTALAIGLDTFHALLSEADRSAIRDAIVDKGIAPSFRGNEHWWVRGANNWNQVCNGGLTLGALAIADSGRKGDAELAAKVIARAVDGLPYSMKHYAPDGAYPEGPGYWEYGTSYNVVMLSAMGSALGTDFGLSKLPGFEKTPEYFLHATGPTGLYFNYSDCGQRGATGVSPAMFWFAGKLGDESLLTQERPMLRALLGIEKPSVRDRFLPLLLGWYVPGASGGEPPAMHYAGQGTTPVAMHRSGWTREATYVGIKAGFAGAPHGQMDAGTFVLDAMGTRWADDLGVENYHGLESRKVDLWNMKQDSQRWTVFRLSAACHNVLTVDGKPHVVEGKASLVSSTPERSIVELTPVYGGQLAAARRGVRLRADGSVLLRDEVAARPDKAATVRWAMLTRAEVELTEGGAILKRDGKTLRARVTGVPGVRVTTYSAQGPNDFDTPNPGTTLLGFEVPLAAGASGAWSVEFLPGETKGTGDGVPLKEW